METVRILGKVYQITNVPETVLTGNVWGQIDCLRQQIYLRQGAGPDHARETFLHECLHALDYCMQIGLEEEQVHALAAGIYALLRDNPSLIDLLREGLA